MFLALEGNEGFLQVIIIQHRVNTLSDLEQASPLHGAEIDLRSNPVDGNIYLHHDPYKIGDSLTSWLDLFQSKGMSGPIIFNSKEDSLESSVLEECRKRDIENFFFLDTTIPTLVKWSRMQKERRFACRFSSYEPLASVQPFAGYVEWVWVDCFHGVYPDMASIEILKKSFKLCLVSPELQGFDLTPSVIDLYTPIMDAVCSKFPQRWASSCEFVKVQMHPTSHRTEI
jgi:hypothetical protein